MKGQYFVLNWGRVDLLFNMKVADYAKIIKIKFPKALYYRGMIPAQDELEIDELDFKSLLKMVDQYPSSVSRAFFSLSNFKEKLEISSGGG